MLTLSGDTASSCLVPTLVPVLPAFMPLFHGSKHFTANGTFIDGSLIINGDSGNGKKGTGIDALRKASLPEAIYDSSARDPLRCFPGTRGDYIRDITGWDSGGWKERQARVLWLHGPAGAGKSALAQTCVERAGNRLDTAFFFSRPHQWNKPTKFFPTIVYQLSMKYPAYGDLVDTKVLRDPLVLEKSIEVQFRELLVRPLQELSTQGRGISNDTVIVIDGLDECGGEDAQRVIVEVITTSAHQQTTPFLWASFSRPEPHITAAFGSEHQQEVYLGSGFRMIREKYKLPTTIAWPSEEVIHRLVNKSGGFFIYCVSAIRYIAGSLGTLGPEAKLQLILALGKPEESKILGGTPLLNLDQFYMLIMQQIPKDVLPYTLLLLFTQTHGVIPVEDHLLINCSILGFSLTAFYAATSNLHSVLEVQLSDGLPVGLSFYHASFSDFLQDVERSTAEFCVETEDIYNWFYSTCVDALRCLSDTDNDDPANILAWPGSKTSNKLTSKHAYGVATGHLFWSSESPLVHPNADVLQRLSCLNWSLAAGWEEGWVTSAEWIEAFFDKIPRNQCPKIIHLYRRGPLDAVRQAIIAIKRGNPTEFAKELQEKRYVIGTGRKKVLLVPSREWEGYYEFLAPY